LKNSPKNYFSTHTEAPRIGKINSSVSWEKYPVDQCTPCKKPVISLKLTLKLLKSLNMHKQLILTLNDDFLIALKLLQSEGGFESFSGFHFNPFYKETSLIYHIFHMA
jgi:hypothetical protein